MSDFSLFGGALLPLLIWPVAVALVLRAAAVPAWGRLGLTAGPLLFGWWLGCLMSLFPGESRAFYGITSLTPALPALWLARRAYAAEIPAEAARTPWTWIWPVVAIAFAGLQAFHSLALPPTEHDALVMQRFAQELGSHWHFWELPRQRWAQDGFQYPLTHPQAISALLAWFSPPGAPGWYYRLPSSLLVLGFWLCVALPPLRQSRTLAGMIAVGALCSAPLFVDNLIRNSQDVFRHAALAAAVMALVGTPARRLHQASLVGVLAGLGATYHNLQLPFAVLLPLALALPRRDAPGIRWRPMLTGLACALAMAAPAHVDNAAHSDSLLIRQSFPYGLGGSSKVIATARKNKYDDHNLTASWLNERLGYAFQPKFGGWVAALFLVTATTALTWPVARRRLSARDFGLMAVAGCFLAIIADPGDWIERATEKNYWENARYPRTIFPVMATSAGMSASALMASLPAGPAGVLTVAASFALAAPSKEYLHWDAKLPQRRNMAIWTSLWAPDDSKLANARGQTSNHARALRWLSSIPEARCMTFREAEYYAWGSSPGITVYHPMASQALAASTGGEALALLRNVDVTCVYLTANDRLLASLNSVAPGFWSLRDAPETTLLRSRNVEIWWLADEIAIDTSDFPVK